MPTSSLRCPNPAVLVNGAPVPGVMEMGISANAHFAAARFRVRAAMPATTAASLLDPDAIVDLQISLGGTFTSLLQGQADSIHIDPIRNTIEIDGRDLTARLLDARTQETFANQTASQIANTLAARHNLTAIVTNTTTLAGRYYGAEHDRITLGQLSRATTEWDLLTFLAAREGFEAFVSGQSLHFEPLSQAGAPLILTPADCVSLSLERALTLARDIEVTVKSWNTRHQAAFTQTARSSPQGTRSSNPQRIVVVRPNLQPNDALQLAQRILADLSSHERIVHAELPGDVTLTPRSWINLTGTGTDFDQTYYVAELDRHFNLAHGYTQTVRLKNANPANNTVITADNPTA